MADEISKNSKRFPSRGCWRSRSARRHSAQLLSAQSQSAALLSDGLQSDERASARWKSRICECVS
jgi:hypothetical protein